MTTIHMMNRTFSMNEQPKWTCSRCRVGTLIFSPADMRELETSASKEHNDDPDWWRTGYTESVRRMAALLVCDDCGDPVGLVAEIRHADDGENSSTEVVPRFVSPAPLLVPRPGRLALAVEQALRRSESLFWADASACANAIRSVVEAILSDHGARRFSITKKRKRVRLDLHARIKEYEAMGRPDVAEMMFAVKWIGNAGSHAVPTKVNLNNGDLLDGFEMVNHVVEKLYGTTERALVGRAKAINKAKRPVSSRAWRPKRARPRRA